MTTPNRYLDFSGLLNVGVSDFLMQENELTAAKNVYSYSIGKLAKVPGYTVAGANTQVVSGEDVRYLHYYERATTLDKYLLAFSDSSTAMKIRYIAPNVSSPVTEWTDINVGSSYDGMAGAKVSAVNYLDKVFVVGYLSGTTYLPNATITGTTFATTDGTNLTNMPQGKYIARYRDLIYVLNAYEDSTARPNRAYYCDEPTGGNITWSPSTAFLEVGYNDGDEITGAHECADRLIIFKKLSMWKWDESTLKEIASVGCDSNRSIIKIRNVLYWFNREGFWRWAGDYPQLISSRAQEFIDAIDQTKLEDVVAVQHDHEYRAFIGDVTVNGYTYTNAWFCFDVRREKCYIRCTYHTGKSSTYFIDTGVKRAYFGSTNGYVYKFATKVDNVYRDGYYDSSNTGHEIDSFFITKALDHGYPESVKFSNSITTFTKHAAKMKLAVDVDLDEEYKESSSSTMENNITDHDIGASGRRYKYKFYEKSGDKSWEFDGFVVETELKEVEK